MSFRDTTDRATRWVAAVTWPGSEPVGAPSFPAPERREVCSPDDGIHLRPVVLYILPARSAGSLAGAQARLRCYACGRRWIEQD